MTWHDEQLYEQTQLLREIVRELRHIVHLLTPHLSALEIHFGDSSMDTSIQVGAVVTAKVVGFDQFGNPFPIDFGANPASWSVDQPSAVELAAGSNPDEESCKGLAATTTPAVLSVSCGGFTATGNITVTEAPPPTPVLSSLGIQFSS